MISEILILVIVLVCFALMFAYNRMLGKRILSRIDEVQWKLALISKIYHGNSLPESNGWSLSWECLFVLIKEIESRNITKILELGSGISTSLIGGFFEGRDVIYHSLEHDEEFIENSVAPKEGRVKLIYSPLKLYEEEDFMWYDLAGIKEELKYELLIIDGPPISIDKSTRYPAVPLLREYLSEGAIIVLDDFHRKHEQEIFKRWKNEGIKFKVLYESNSKKEKRFIVLKLDS